MYQKKPLNNEELNVILPILIKVLKKTSPLKTIKAPKIVEGMNNIRIRDGKFKQVFTETMLRRMSNHIRSYGILPLIANNDGYYISSDIRDIDEQIKSFEDRIAGMNCAIKGLKEYKSMLYHEAELNDPFGISESEWK